MKEKIFIFESYLCKDIADELSKEGIKTKNIKDIKDEELEKINAFGIEEDLPIDNILKYDILKYINKGINIIDILKTYHFFLDKKDITYYYFNQNFSIKEEKCKAFYFYILTDDKFVDDKSILSNKSNDKNLLISNYINDRLNKVPSLIPHIMDLRRERIIDIINDVKKIEEKNNIDLSEYKDLLLNELYKEPIKKNTTKKKNKKEDFLNKEQEKLKELSKKKELLLQKYNEIIGEDI